jgi:hypothetical protein
MYDSPIAISLYFAVFILFIIMLVVYGRKHKQKYSDFSIELSDNKIKIIDNDNIIILNQSEIHEIIMRFRHIKGEQEFIGTKGTPSQGDRNYIKIVTKHTTIEKRIFIPEDMFYHRFYLLGIRLKEMGLPVKMKGFYNY